jgi:hypothetical protein
MKTDDMQDAIAREVGEFHRKLGLCRHRKVIDGKVHCKKKNEIYNFNNSCMDCEFLPKLPKIASLKRYLTISITDEIKNAIENLENHLGQAEQLNQAMQADTAKGINIGCTHEDTMNIQIDIDKCWKNLQKIKKTVEKW